MTLSMPALSILQAVPLLSTVPLLARVPLLSGVPSWAPPLGAGLGLLAVIGLLDGSFSGFRAAQGRTGRLAYWRDWGLAMLRGALCGWW